MKKIIALLLCVAFLLSVVPYDAIAAENTQSVSNAVVYLNGTNGSDSNSGKTAAKAVKTLAKAVEVANTFTNAENVTVVVTGITNLADKQHNRLHRLPQGYTERRRLIQLEYGKDCALTHKRHLGCAERLRPDGHQGSIQL